MRNARLPEIITKSISKELHELPVKHHRYQLELLFKKKISMENKKEHEKKIKAIQDHGYNFLFALENLYNIMHEIEPEFFGSVISKAALVMQAPTKKNREEFQAEFNRLKVGIDTYKSSHPFSTGVGYLVLNSLALILGIALLITAAVLASIPLAIPGVGIALSLMGFAGLIGTLTFATMLYENASTQYEFFNNKYLEATESFINDITSDDFENTFPKI